ncbi:hypothetical protein T03_14008 [Trichinella britovi]|uniref:Uncharacterized protein n=1 Tax=Trichinella britovi TaxID=45882 RepID=A0A0V1AJ82_TRIBR|nr:hypothetical protein T03_14008 [Trichinella britovi]
MIIFWQSICVLFGEIISKCNRYFLIWNVEP